MSQMLQKCLLLAVIINLSSATSPCPWASQVTELDSSCICDYNLARELSVQCDIVDFNQLLTAIRRYAAKTTVDLFYINNSTIGILKNSSLSSIRINNMQLSGCKIKTIEEDAFKGQENSMRTLNLKDNELTEIPTTTLKYLRNLTVLDISLNNITRVENDAFQNLKLVTLKIADNDITLAPGAFRGLEKSLKNLNLKGTRQKLVPEALRGLKTLAFLDLSQNGIKELPGVVGKKAFEGLNSLTGLNLERNLIQNIDADAFYGIKDTLSSLSLLNNLIPDFPTGAISSIHDLRVLDIGFNLITELPVNAFHNNPSITLLAIDGNPLSTVPEEALATLNGTLRGLSLGGRFLVCDCKLRWIANWIRTKDLQVTSRERKPQFCGSPLRLQERSFYNIDPEEMVCERPSEIIGIGTVESVDTKEPMGPVTGVVEGLLPTTRSPLPPPTTPSTTSETTPKATYTNATYSTSFTSPISTTEIRQTDTPLTSPRTVSTSTRSTAARTGNVVIVKTTQAPARIPQAGEHNTMHQPKPPMVFASSDQRPLYKSRNTDKIILKDVIRQDNTVIITWDSQSPKAIEFRVVYRVFGDNEFKQAPPLDASEREFKIKNVPDNECLIVCVLSLEDSNVTPANVPYNQCREVRTEPSPTSNMDKITIAASAAICATIVMAVIIFVVANRRRARQLHTIHSLDQAKSGGPIAGLPVNCCSNVGPTPSPAGPLASMATLSAYNAQKEWDQVSAYSNRSIPRPRIFPIDRQGFIQNSFTGSITRASCIDDVRSQASHYGELRQSRQSLAAASDRMSRNGYPGNHLPPHASARRQRPRSRNRTLEQNPPPRPGSRYSLADSTHTLNNYEENNWTDHDMDIYMSRNPTTRSGLVPL
ncbi:leucine-rich repeat and fibronectin type-III domain-containing protein 5 isoform X3 [Diachasmimorpha longicaudata]|uniref:leucine-rich repeat and fibronectin type-III domain-containing protein 5 isoform X3 n=1 Tax=Diachasmimorpha longicaudata TaxID=58733 RepID=UPI0030B914F2